MTGKRNPKTTWRPRFPRQLWAAGLALLAVALPASAAPSPAAAPRPHLEVVVAGDMVIVEARDVSRERILRKIARRTGLVVEIDGPLDDVVTIDLYRLPLREALERILRGEGFVLRYVDPSRRGRGSRSSLWVYPTKPVGGGVENCRAGRPCGGDAAPAEGPERPRLARADVEAMTRLAAVAEMAEGATDESSLAALADAAFSDPSPAVREEALYVLGELGGETALATLEQALLDPDPGVRKATVEALGDLGGEGAAWALATALGDQDPALREDAVHTLEDLGGDLAATLLERALADPHPAVRQAAGEALEELD